MQCKVMELCSLTFCRAVTVLVVVCFCSFESNVEGGVLVNNNPRTVLADENHASLMTVGPVLPVNLIWYGNFSAEKRSSIKAFLVALRMKAPTLASNPLTHSWWDFTSSFTDSKGTTIAAKLHVAGEVSLPSKGRKSLVDGDIQNLAVRSLRNLHAHPSAIYMVMTAAEIQLEQFCMNSCASRFERLNKTLTTGKGLPYFWAAGNRGTRCPRLCAWPFAKPQHHGLTNVSEPRPNSNVGVDGLLINLAYALSSAFTIPFSTGDYFQGDAMVPLEVATECAGIYAVAGFTGQPLTDKANINASSNSSTISANRIDKNMFLMPALWNPFTY